VRDSGAVFAHANYTRTCLVDVADTTQKASTRSTSAGFGCRIRTHELFPLHHLTGASAIGETVDISCPNLMCD